MATVIRLRRGGRANAPYYRVVVTDNRARARGAVTAELGYYHPCARPEPRAEIDAAQALEWLKQGAKPTPTARKVLSDHGVLQAFATGAAIAPKQDEGAETEPAAG